MATTDLQLHSVSFGPDRLEVSFIDPRHITEAGMTITTYQMNIGAGYEDEATELVEAVEALIARYELIKRNPPMSIASRDRS